MARRKKGDLVDGWLVLDKPLDVTSTEAVAIGRRLFNAQKVGHAGTLDPMASGILPLAFGEATKTVPYLMEAQKTYQFAIAWGISTDSHDSEGAETRRSDVRPAADAIAAALAGFVGEIDQVPPVYSAIKVQGERAYDLARAGEAVELKARKVRLDAARLVSADDPDLTLCEVDCGKGFYIRALVRDLAAKLGAEGHVASLRRTRVGPFTLDKSIGLDKLREKVQEGTALNCLLPLETALDDIPALAISTAEASDLRLGRAIALLPYQIEDLRPRFRTRVIDGQDASRTVLAMCEDMAVALGDVRAGRFKPSRIFYPESR